MKTSGISSQASKLDNPYGIFVIEFQKCRVNQRTAIVAGVISEAQYIKRKVDYNLGYKLKLANFTFFEISK